MSNTSSERLANMLERLCDAQTRDSELEASNTVIIGTESEDDSQDNAKVSHENNENQVDK